MTRSLVFAGLLGLAITPGLMAQTVSTPSEQTRDAAIAALTQRLDRQSQQIEALAREVTRLSNLIEDKLGPGSTSVEPSTAVRPSATARPVVSATPAPAATPADLPPGAVMHVVAKGENLTVIARKYNTTVDEILKTNKIQDERKLQIGQNLVIPGPGGSGATPNASATPAASPANSPH